MTENNLITVEGYATALLTLLEIPGLIVDYIVVAEPEQHMQTYGETYNPAALNEMNTNIRYGTFYLSMIQGQLSNNPVLATAGYNAGPNRARRWQPDYQPIEADQYTETIPLLETRDYVKHVMTNATHYGVVLGQGAQSLIQRMKVIPMRSSP